MKIKTKRKLLFASLILSTATLGICSAIKTKSTNKKNKTENIVYDSEFEKIRWGSIVEKQNYLQDVYSKLNPNYIESVIYDPFFKKTEDYLREELKPYVENNSLLEQIIAKAINSSTSKDHNCQVLAISYQIGNRRKRPVFVREKLFDSKAILKTEDVKSVLRHEDEHGRQEYEGYDFGDINITGKEIMPFFIKNELRPAISDAINEISAYSIQLQAIINGEDRVSQRMKEITKINLRNITKIMENAANKGKLTKLEEQFARHQIQKYSTIIKSVKE